MAQVSEISNIASNSATRTVAKLYLSSDVRAAAGISRSHFDFYLREGLVQPVGRTESGYLIFDETEVSLLKRIVASRQDGQALKAIREDIGR
jgi:MerR family transcriptional regulator, Zn(II)-responsive regulator of zntA